MLPVLPHLAELLPALLEAGESVAQEHVLRVGLVLRDTLAHRAHLLVVLRVAVDLLTDGGVLLEKLLSFR